MIDAKKIGIILLLAAVAYLGALGAVRFAMNPKSEDETEASTVSEKKENEAVDNQLRHSQEADLESAIEASEPAPFPPAETASPAPSAKTVGVPPGQTPEGTALDSEIEIEKCWDASGLEHSAKECDEINNLKAKILERLYVMDQCREQEAGEEARGNLDLGMELDFASARTSFWATPSSEMRNSMETAACIKERMIHFNVGAQNHRFARYKYSMSVRFFDEKRVVDVQRVEVAAKTLIEEDRGTIVPVTRERVRVRKKPVDGEILCKISSDSTVTLFDRQGDWCFIRTPRGTVGWMVCWGLGLDSDAGPKAP